MNNHALPILFALGLLTSNSSFAQTRSQSHAMSGGMFYHMGAARIDTDLADIRGLTKGLGGRMAFNVSRSVRVGGMGFNSGFTYESNSGIEGSYVSMRAGGVTAEYVHPFSRNLQLSLGVLAGGARLFHLNILSHNGSNKLVTYEKHGSMIGAPLILLEYKIGKSYSLSCLYNWIVGNNIVSGYSYGHCLHVGFLFNR